MTAFRMLAICVVLIGAGPALAAMGGASSMSATQAAAKSGNTAAASALSNTVSSGSCVATCQRNGHTNCQQTCRPGTCYYKAGNPFCIR